MKLTPFFVEVLANFSTINSGMIFKPGNILRTMSQHKTILAQAEVEEIFESEFGVYDLSQMLALLSMNKASPEIEIEKESMVFVGLGGKGKIRQRFTDTKLILGAPDKNLKINTFEAEFTLDHDVFKWIFNASSILKCPHTVIRGEPGEKMTMSAIDVKGQIVDSAQVTLDATARKKFNVVFKNDNIKVISGKYDVSISKSGFAIFKHADKKLQYWIAIEGSSQFEA